MRRKDEKRREVLEWIQTVSMLGIFILLFLEMLLKFNIL